MLRQLHALAFIVFCVAAIQAQPFVPRVVSTEPLQRKTFAQIWGDRVMWRDFRETGGLYEFRLSTETEQKVYDLELGNDHRGDLLSFEEDGLPKVFNLVSGEKFAFDTQVSSFAYTSLGDDWLAWSALIGNYDIFARRVDETGQPYGEIVNLDARSGIQTQVDIDGDYATWTDRSRSPFQINLMNLNSGERVTLGHGDYPTIHGNLVAWTNNSGVWAHDISTGTSERISEIRSEEDPGVWGDQIVWVWDGEMHGFNVATDDSFTIQLPSTGLGTPFAFAPTIYENQVAWAQHQPGPGGLHHDIYLMELPSRIECDFDGDGLCSITDIDAMFAQGPIAEIVDVMPGANDQFDLDADGDIDLDDRDQWLMIAASRNGLTSPYRLGDANLDGFVEVADFNAWNGSKFQFVASWSKGNFNGDEVVDVSDFNDWNINRFTASDTAVVPEPNGYTIAVALLCVIMSRIRITRAGQVLGG